MKNSTLIPQDTAKRVVSDALQLRVGRGRRFSYHGLAEVTGIPERTLDSYARGDVAPGAANLLSLFRVLGPSFTSDVLTECGQRALLGDASDPEHLRTLGALGAMIAELSEAVSDGHVDHREAAQLRPLAAELIEMLTPIARAGGAA